MYKVFVRLALSAGVFAMLAGAPPAAQAVNCEGGFVGTEYRRCDFKRDDMLSGSYCIHFNRSPVDTDLLVMTFPGGAVFGCTCEATGSFTAPNFQAGKDFLCGIASSQAVPGYTADAISGKVLGQKIKKGQYRDGYAPFHTSVFECEPDPLCP